MIEVEPIEVLLGTHEETRQELLGPLPGFIDVMICVGRPDTKDVRSGRDRRCVLNGLDLDGSAGRWAPALQLFLDRYVHESRFPQVALSNFPPAAIQPLAGISGALGTPVTWSE